MLLPEAVEALSALAHGHRLAVFRLLVRAGPDGMAAGANARETGVPASTLSTHLALLHRARLIQARRAGRSIIYAADFDGMRKLMGFLAADCCGGRPEICAPFVTAAQGCGEPA
jgi:DNA-binding transcriptional ArsR family regulator